MGLCLGVFAAPHAITGDIGPYGCRTAEGNPVIRLETSLGRIDAILYSRLAPTTACNILRYVTAGAFDGGSFFRTVRKDNQQTAPVKIGVIQAEVRAGAPLFSPIALERTSVTTVHHVDGSLSLARAKPDDGVSSFFICIGSQPELDFGGRRNPDGQGFAAFGRVVRGMNVVRRIQMSRATGEHLNPPILIESVRVLSQ